MRSRRLCSHLSYRLRHVRSERLRHCRRRCRAAAFPENLQDTLHPAPCSRSARPRGCDTSLNPHRSENVPSTWLVAHRFFLTRGAEWSLASVATRRAPRARERRQMQHCPTTPRSVNARLVERHRSVSETTARASPGHGELRFRVQRRARPSVGGKRIRKPRRG
jgi:hypothetical protein